MNAQDLMLNDAWNTKTTNICTLNMKSIMTECNKMEKECKNYSKMQTEYKQVA